MVIAAHADLVTAVDRSQRSITTAVGVDWWSDTADNLISNPDFEAGTTGWTGVLSGFDTATIAQSGTRAYAGTKSLLVTWPTTGATQGSAVTTTVTTEVGRKYRARFRLRVPTGSPQPRPFVFFLQAGTAGTASDGWQTVDLVFIATNTSHAVGIYVPTATSGQTVHLDDAWCVPWMDLSPMVASATITRALSADLPDIAGIATGDVAAEATVVLSGVDPALATPTSAARLLQPFNAASPLWRRDRAARPMTLDIGLLTDTGERRVRRFTGRTRGVEVDPAEGTATVTGLDHAELLRGPAELPTVVANAVIDGDWIRPGLNAQWVVDYLLRRAGVYATPPPRPGSVLSATMHGSAYPEIGTLDGAGDTSGVGAAVGFVPGPFALAAYSDVFNPPGEPIDSRLGPHTQWFARYYLDGSGIQSDTSSGLLIEGWFYCPAAGGVFGSGGFFPSIGSDLASGSRQKVDIIFGAGTGFLLSWYTNAAGSAVTVTGPAMTMDDDWHYLAVQISWPTTTTIRVTFRVDGTSTTPADVTIPARTTQTPLVWVDFFGGPLVEAFQITSETPATAAPWNDDWTPGATHPGATLEPSLLELTATPQLDPTATRWGTIKEIASAEAAVCGFDEGGNFVYRSRRTAPVAAARTLTAERSIAALRTVERVDAVRNRIRVPAAAYQVLPAAAVWQLSTVQAVPRRSTLTIIANFAGPVVGLSTEWSIVPLGAGGPDSGYRAARNPDGTGGPVTNLTAGITQLSPTTAKIAIRNPNAFDIYLVSPTGIGYPTSSDGQPVARLWGQLITDRATATDDTGTDPTIAAGLVAEALWQPSIDRIGTQPLDVPASVWRQNTLDAQALADDLLALLYREKPVLEQVVVAGDPTLQLGDRVHLSDPDGTTGLDDPVIVVGITEDVDDDGGYTQRLTVRLVAPPGGWILGDPSRSVLGDTTRL